MEDRKNDYDCRVCDGEAMVDGELCGACEATGCQDIAARARRDFDCKRSREWMQG